MSSNNNHNTQNYSNLPMDQTDNSFAPLQILDNGNESTQHTLINNTGISNLDSLNVNTINTINTTTSVPQNISFEFYFHLPNDTCIYRVTYSELHPSENIRLLNNFAETRNFLRYH
ncbi:hypothetical protein RhiirA5_442225 [Rhizophagus irregularis]|uniref:Uncharacterized protein n=1 Tax=Rhizophagus irregularis TaxID=588596 RepID=A0A2N0NEX7_9GLOM|nr:hypothetical protein RhiirA5_442225 [Rhizophagus irregularis]